MGDILQVKILSVTPSTSLPLTDLAQQREEAARKALQQVQQTSAMIFASSFSGKWGDYDPDGITHWEEAQPPNPPPSDNPIPLLNLPFSHSHISEVPTR